MSKSIAKLRRRMGASGASTAPGTLTAAQLTTVIRRLGFVALKAHETIIAKLLEQGDQALAEVVNDSFKPLVDQLLHFELEERDTEVDHEVP